MSAYSSPHWPENGHALDPYHSEATRGTNRPPNHPQDSRWYHGEAGTRTPYGGRGYRHSETTEWNHYSSHPGPGGTQENGYREEQCGDPPPLRPDQRYGMGYRGEVEDPRLCRRDMLGRDWGRYGDSHGNPHSFPSPHAQPSPPSHSHGSPRFFPNPLAQPSPTSHHGSPRPFSTTHAQPSPTLLIHGSPHSFPSPHAQPSPTSHIHGSPHSFPSPTSHHGSPRPFSTTHAQPSPTSHTHGSPRPFPAQPSPTSHTHGSPHPFPAQPSPTSHIHGSPHSFPSPTSHHGSPRPFSTTHAQPSPTSHTHGSPRPFPAQPSPTSHTHGSPHSFPSPHTQRSPNTNSPHAYSSPRAYPPSDPSGIAPGNQPPHGSYNDHGHWYSDGYQQNEWGGERLPMNENRGFPTSNQYSGGKYQNDVSDLARYHAAQRIDHRKTLLPNPSNDRSQALSGQRGGPVDSSSTVNPPRHMNYEEPPEAIQRGRSSSLDSRGRRMHHEQRNSWESGNEETSYYMPPGSRNEERRYPLRYKLQQNQLTDNSMRKAYGYQRKDGFGLESIRDPRLHRKAGIQPAPQLALIFKEHSYCKRNALACSELEPVPEKSTPNLQQPSESCFLTTMAPVQAQRRKVAAITRKDEVAPPVGKGSGKSLAKLNETKVVPSSNAPSIPNETTAKVIQGPSKPSENKIVQSKSISNTRSVQNGIVPKEESVPEDDKSKLGDKNVRTDEDKVNRIKTAPVFPNRVRSLPLTPSSDITFRHLSQRISLDGFELDLDTEPETSEDEAMKVEGGSLVVSLSSSHLEMPEGQQPNLWSVTATGSSKIRLSKLSSDAVAAASLKLSLKQFASNRIKLRNGRLLPSSTLAIYASRKSRQHSELSDDGHDMKDEEPRYSDDSSGEVSPEELDMQSAGNPSVPDNPGIPGNPGRGGKRVSLRRKRGRRGLRFIHYGRNKKKFPGGGLQESKEQPKANSDEGSPTKRPKISPRFQDFVPVVFETRSRAETATLLRRKEMVKEIEQHDRERTQTARLEDDSDDSSYVHDRDGSYVHDRDGSYIHDRDGSYVHDRDGSLVHDRDGSYVHDRDGSYVHDRDGSLVHDRDGSLVHDRDGSLVHDRDGSLVHDRDGSLVHDHDGSLVHDRDGSYLHDDSSSSYSFTFTTSSSLTSRDLDSAVGSNSMLAEFSPELIARCKKIATARSSGDTPLHKVCRTGKYDMVRYLLLVEGAQVNVQDYAGWTPLHEACSSGNMGVAELLLRHGADTNISSTDGTRPIHDAIENGSLDMVRLLIMHGADPLAEMGDKTPVEYAMAMKQEDICKYLQNVVRERQKNRPMKTSSPPLKPSTRQSQKQKLFKHAEQAEESEVAIPVDGYSPNDPKFGEELDFPLFYITPIIEMSEKQFLQVYNFEISSGSNPRRHNFHLLDDVLEELDMNESELYEHCPDIGTLELTIAEFLKRMKHPYYNKQLLVPENLQSCPKTAKIKFIPLCNKLRSLLDIEINNLDD